MSGSTSSMTDIRRGPPVGDSNSRTEEPRGGKKDAWRPRIWFTKISLAQRLPSLHDEHFILSIQTTSLPTPVTPMSAFAARRAAQEALASAKAANPAPPAPTPKRQQASEPFVVPQSPESPSVSDYEESVASEPEPSTKRRKTAKVVKSATPTNTRYYTAPKEPEERSKRSRKQRRFSPSAAVASDDDAGSSEDEDNESEAAFETDMDGAATPWSTAQSPRVLEPGPSRQR